MKFMSATIDADQVAVAVQQITSLAPVVAAAHDECMKTRNEEEAAEAALLAKVLEIVKPSLRAVSKRVVSVSYESGGRDGCHPVSRVEYHDVQGVMVYNAYSTEEDGSGNRGTYVGTRLYVSRDAQLFEVERAGSWSHWQGEASEWTSTVTPVTCLGAARDYGINVILDRLAATLSERVDESLKEVAQRTQHMRARAERIRVILALMGAP
jgi:hypothetical protein